jgi:chromosomal replication initiator protein
VNRVPHASSRRDVVAVWDDVAALLRTRLGEKNFSSWIAALHCTQAGEGVVALEAPDTVSQGWVSRHFAGAIEAAAAEVLRAPCTLQLRTATPPPVLSLRGVRPSLTHVFGTFVLGASNAHAYSAASALSDGSSRAPLFIHGPSGVGKTHLLHAVFHSLEARGVAATCLPAARLVSALVSAYGTRTMETLWDALSPLGALLLDDVHSLAGQEAVQDRLIDGLLAWQEEGRLLVVTSDRAPAEFPALAERVRARFEGGVVAGIDVPDPALRLALVARKSAGLGITLESELAARIAAHLGANVRRLEGALTRLVAHARFFGRALDETLALEVLPELRAPRPPTITVERIVAETAAAFGLVARLLRGHSRRRDLTLARHVAMYLARRLLRRPFADLGAAFGRDHTTVLHATRNVGARIANDRALAATVEGIEHHLTMDPR